MSTSTLHPATGLDASHFSFRDQTPVSRGPSLDSSRLLLQLLQLGQSATAEAPPEDLALDGVITSRTLRVLLTALQQRDPSTVQHSRRVAQLAVGMAQFLGWEGRHVRLMEVAGLLHDVGKIGVPDSILFKPGALGPDEAALMSLHHNLSVDVLQVCGVDWEVIEMVGQSRDPYGSSHGQFRKPGVPMHMGARILAVADAYDAMRTSQVYRPASTHAEALQMLRDNSGKQFDGNVVGALARWTQDTTEPLEHSREDDLANVMGALATTDPWELQDAATLGPIFSYLYLLESLYDGFAVFDSQLQPQLWNGGAERMLLLSASDLLRRPLTGQQLQYFDSQNQPLAFDLLPAVQALSTGRVSTSQQKMQTTSGQWLSVEIQTVPLVDDQGIIQGVAEIYRDLSRTSRRPQEYHALRQAATRDALTGVRNRGELETQLTMLVAEAAKNQFAEPFSVIFADVDHFKSVNDTFGHGVGDLVLIEVARLLQNETYSGEIVGRYGGEEFVILCPATDIKQAVKRADRIRLAIPQLKIEGLGTRRITSSFGVTQAGPGDSVESVLRRADESLYRAKHEGRNKVCSQMQADSLHDQRSKPALPAGQQLIYQDSFMAVVAEDMIVYKLSGFVTGEKGQLLEVSANRVLIRIGSHGWWPFWGPRPESLPVDLEINFGDVKPDAKKRSGRNGPQIEVQVSVRPGCRWKDKAQFEARARRVCKELMAYFAGEIRNG